MKCPFCKEPLTIGENRRFQTLCEHISNPNHIPDKRPTNVCTCVDGKHYFWNDDGEAYFISKDDTVRNQHEAQYNNLDAIDSIAREINEEIASKYLNKLN